MKTKEQKIKDKYVKTGGNYCPYCKSYEIITSTPEISDSGLIFCGVRCGDCNKEWDDTYTLTGVDLQTPIPETPNSIKFIKTSHTSK